MPISNDAFLKLITERFKNIHGCHTAILYGSRARGDFTQNSDYDILGIRDDGRVIRDTLISDSNEILDGFIYSTSDIVGKEEAFLRIKDGIVLFERDQFGVKLLNEIESIFARGPDPYPSDEIKACHDWVSKMLLRIQRDDLEGNYRRHWLLFQLLEDYFRLRNIWFMGAKRSLAYLRENDLVTFELYEASVRPGASIKEIEALALEVISKP
jgi:predicted nucleotidyltransferase